MKENCAGNIHLVPQTNEVRSFLLETEAHCWCSKKPFGHEKALLVAFATLVEKNASDNLTKDDVYATITLFKGIAGIDPVNKPECTDDILRAKQKKVFEMQIPAMEDINFTNNNGWIKTLLGFYRSHIYALIDNKNKILEFFHERIFSNGLKRSMTSQEQVQYFESKIRKLINNTKNYSL